MADIEVRDRLALALDLDDLAEARRLALSVAEYFAVVKVGLELYSAAGPAAVETFTKEGFSVFVDLKLHDIPTTVERAARVVAGLGATFLTVHTAGGEAMVKAAVKGLTEGAIEGNTPIALGVTILTSDAEAPRSLLAERAGLAAAAGCGGLVCSALDLDVVRRAAPGLLCIVPGTRMVGEATDDQARVATPAQAVSQGADILVIGRGVTRASDPVAASAALAAELSGVLPLA